MCDKGVKSQKRKLLVGDGILGGEGLTDLT
jgi:hypothetical protein